MKKFAIFLLVLVAVFTSCEKLVLDAVSDEVTVSFATVVESGNILTKASFSDEVINNLQYNYPKIIKLYGEDNDRYYELDLSADNTFSVQKGLYTLCCTTGEYDSSCKWKPNETVPLTVKRDAAVQSPKYGFYTGYRITITESKEYSVPLLINAFIVASEKSKVSYLKANGSTSYLHTTENYYYYILAYPMNIIGTSYVPANVTVELGGTDEYETTTITKVTKNEDVLGKYFIYSPNANENRTFDFAVGGWSNGE